MSPIFPVGEKFVAFGLNWLSFSGPKAEKEAKARAKEDEVPYIVCMKDEDGGHFGYLKDYDVEAAGGKPKKGRLVSGAALFATMPNVAQNAVFIHPYKPVGGDQRVTALVVLYQGKVFEDRAEVRGTDVRAHIAKLIEVLRDSSGGGSDEGDLDFQLYTTEPDGYPDAQALSLQDLLGGDDGAAGVVDARSYLAIRLLLVTIILLLLGYYGWGQYEDHRQRERLAQMPAQEGPSPTELYQQALYAQLKQIGVNPATFAAIALKTMGARETQTAGFQMTEASCDESGLCIEIWDRMAGVGVLDEFIAANAGAQITPSDKGDGLKLIYRLQIPRAATKREALPSSRDYVVPLQSLLQRYSAIGISAKTDAIKLFALPTGVAEASLPRGIGVGAATLGLSGPTGLVKDLLSADIGEGLRLPSNIYINEIKYVLSGSPATTTFSLKGTYYVNQ